MKKIVLIATCFWGFTFLSCRKDATKIDGPSIEELYSSFKVLANFKANKDSVDFASGATVGFSATFNKIVSWKITITGTTTKARKVFSGQSKSIDAASTVWNGTTTYFPLFAAENCIAKLTIDGVTDTFQVPIKIKNTRVINTSLVIADYENGFNAAWVKFVQTGANMDFNIKSDTSKVQGNSYLNMAGTVNWDWLIGLIDYPASAYSTTSNTLNLNANPDAVYFNCLIYGVPNTNMSKVLFQFKEDENADGVFNANNEDEYALNIDVTWTGWKLISIKYSDITALVNGQPVTPKGNSIHNPNKIGKISMLHLADKALGAAACKIDFICFTSAPLEL